MRRSGSRSRYFVKRIPADLRDRIAGLTIDLPIGDAITSIVLKATTQAVRVSLRSDVPAEVKARAQRVDAYLENVWQALRQNAPIPISHKQATALAGEVYRAWAAPEGRERTIAVELTQDRRWVPAEIEPAEEPLLWEAAFESIKAAPNEDPFHLSPILEERFGPLVDRLLLKKGIASTDRLSRDQILFAVRKAFEDAFRRREKQAQGDYSPDPNLARFPPWSPAETSHARSEGPKVAIKLSVLIEEWWAEAKAAGRSQSTYESYRNTVRRLGLFLGHENAAEITADNIIAFKDERLAAGISPRTVKESDLAGLRSVFQRAVRNKRLDTNPTTGVTVLRFKPTRLRTKSLTLEEAGAILAHSRDFRPSKHEDPKGVAAKRWVPWLCAYTGARVGELIQLRKRDVKLVGAFWVLTITPEAGTVKDKQARDIVLHPHLVEQGFLAFLDSAAEGYLFLRVSEGDDIRGAWRGMKNRLTVFVREAVTDVRVAPNHGMRHLFKTVGREAGIEDRVLDAIQGHAPSSVGGHYGEVTLATKAKAIERFPRFSLSPPDCESSPDAAD